MAQNMELSRIVKFDGTNYQLWKFSVSITLRATELMDIVAGKETKPTENNEDIKKWEKRDNQAMVIFLSSICENQLSYLVNCQTAADMWNKLITIHEQKTEVSKHIIYQKFYEVQMLKGQNIASFISEIESIVKQLKDMGEKISDIAVISKIINSLPPKFDMFVTAWDSVDAAKQTLSELIARLLKEEQKTIVGERREENLALQVQSMKIKSNSMKNSVKKKRNIQELKQKTKCGYCKQTGHWWRECPNRKKNNNTSRSSTRNDDNNVEALTCNFSFLTEKQIMTNRCG